MKLSIGLAACCAAMLLAVAPASAEVLSNGGYYKLKGPYIQPPYWAPQQETETQQEKRVAAYDDTVPYGGALRLKAYGNLSLQPTAPQGAQPVTQPQVLRYPRYYTRYLHDFNTGRTLSSSPTSPGRAYPMAYTYRTIDADASLNMHNYKNMNTYERASTQVERGW